MAQKIDVFEMLQKALQNERLAHAYVLNGAFEYSNTLEIAKLLLCQQDHSICDACSACLKLNSQNHPDVTWIDPDGASIKIHQVEEMLSNVHIRPFESHHKVIFFHQAHLMTEQAQNKLLKTIEEPPAYAVLFFVTEHPDRLLETIRSRCQIIGRIPEEVPVIDKAHELAVDFIASLEFNDAGRILEYGTHFKKDKELFVLFLNHVCILLRDLLVLQETNNKSLLHQENLIILEERTQIARLSKKLKKSKMLDLIFYIDDLHLKIKSNMNFDLTVDKFLFHCIED